MQCHPGQKDYVSDFLKHFDAHLPSEKQIKNKQQQSTWDAGKRNANANAREIFKNIFDAHLPAWKQMKNKQQQ